MFRSIIPDEDSGDNRAELLAAGLSGGALPAEEAAVALMLRLPYGVGLRDDVWRAFVLDDGETAAYTWPDLAKAAEDGDLPLSRGERYLVRAACAIANPMCAAPLHQVVSAIERPNFDLLIAALYHAAGRQNPADQLAARETENAELRRRLDAYAVGEARLHDQIAELSALAARAEEEAVRGTADGTGEPIPADVEGHPVNGRGWYDDATGLISGPIADDPEDDEPADRCPPVATLPRDDQAGIGWRCIACGAAWSGDRAHPQPAPAAASTSPAGGAR